MRYSRFEDVPVWQDGIKLAAMAFTLTQGRSRLMAGDLANQLQRAALSVPNNIAEGFERGTTPELIQFLYIAKGSAGEVRSMCHVVNRLAWLEHMRSEIDVMASLARSISVQIVGWTKSLQDSEITGVRHLNGRARRQQEDLRRAEAFMEKMRAMTEGGKAVTSEEMSTGSESEHSPGE